MTDIITSVSYAIVQAMMHDLPDVEYEAPDYSQGWEKAKELPRKKQVRRPYESEIEVTSFTQSWASTALGFGGIGGAAITPAQTTVVTHGVSHAVYFGRRLAYVATNPAKKFYTDLMSHNMVAQSDAAQYDSGADCEIVIYP
jgi:hypothetical protein